MGLDLGTGWRNDISETGPNSPALLLGVSGTHPQKNPQTDPFPAPGTAAGSPRAAEPSIIYFSAGEAKPKRPKKSQRTAEPHSGRAGTGAADGTDLHPQTAK